MPILINDTAPRSQYTATSGQTVFSVPFEFFANSDLKVYRNATLLTLTTNYTVTGAGVTGGGTLTLVTGATAGDIVTIVRDVPVARTSDFPTSGPFNIEALNTDLDRLTAMIQQQETLDSRSLRLDQFDTPNSFNVLPVKADRLGRLLQFNASTGQPEVGPTSSEIANAQTYATNASNSATAAASSSTSASNSATAAASSAALVSDFITDVATGSGSSLVGYNRGGAGAVDRTVQSRLRDRVSVKDFGAVGDGVANDTAAIQAAIDAIPAVGGSLYFPAGTYKVTSTVNITDKTVSIYGDGSGQDIGTTNGSYIVFHSLGTANGFVFDNVDGAYMRDIAIVADTSTRPTGGYLVVYQGTSGGFYHSDWQNVLVAGGYNGMLLKNGFNFKSFNSIWKTFNGDQVILLNGSSDLDDVQATEFTNCTIAADGSTTTDLCVMDGFAASTKFTSCALLFGRHGIWLRDTYSTSNDPDFTYFIGGGMENLEGDCFRAEAGNHIIINGAYFSADGERSRCFYTSSSFGGEITISGSYFRGAGRGGVWLEDGNATISGNTIINNNKPSPTVYSVSNCANNGSGLIRVTTSAANFFETNDMVEIQSVTGTTEANGIWVVTVINSTTFDLSINANSDTGAASAFVNAYVSGGTAEIASASIRILPTASWVNIVGNSLGGGSSGTRQTEYGIHSAGSNVIAFANSAQSVRQAVFQSISNTRLSYGSRNVGVTSISGVPDPYATDGVLSLSISGAVSAGTYSFFGQNFVAGQKIKIIRITRNLSSAGGNIVSAAIQVDGVTVSTTSQNGSTATDTTLAAPIVIDGMTTAKRVTVVLSITGAPTGFAFDAQYQIIS
jgi:hypothetical protein